MHVNRYVASRRSDSELGQSSFAKGCTGGTDGCAPPEVPGREGREEAPSGFEPE